MKLKKGFSVLCILTLFLPALAGAAAPAEIPRTGVTKCYDGAGTEIDCEGTRQDGAIQAGAVWPVPRFTAGGNTVTDELTGLVWAQNANLLGTDDADKDADGTAGDGLVTWQHALDYIATLNQNSYLGHADWRLPNINELLSLRDMSRYPIPLQAGSQFSNVQGSVYWTSTSKTNTTYEVWVVNFLHGQPYYTSKEGAFYVWPVRGDSTSGDSAVSLPKTGQTTCYDTAGADIACAGTGQDGELQKGVAWPAPRFINNGDTVTDLLTGLEWTKDANPKGYLLWQDASDYVKTLTTGGQNDWRLPNVNELCSLIDYSQYYPALPPGHPFENLTAGGSGGNYIWTSTYRGYDPALKWIVDLQRPYVTATQIHTLVWPVRAGQVGNPLISTTTSTAAPETTTTTAAAETTTTAAATTTAAGDTTTTTSAATAPVTKPDRYTIPWNVLLDVDAEEGVLANDAGADLRALLDTAPGHGTLSLQEDGSFTYMPESDYVGRDTFTYYVQAGLYASPPETVTVRVTYVDFEDLWDNCSATQVLGPDSPKLEPLRALRDETLARSAVGRALIKLYYRNTDRINAAIKRSPVLRAAATLLFDAASRLADNGR